MAAFSSNRERWLWIWTLAVVMAIYTTLAFAQSLSGMLRAQGLLEISFGAGVLLIALAIIAYAMKAKANAAGFAVALGVIAVYLLVFVRMASPEERTHIIEYSVVAILIYEALKERVRNGRRVFAPALIAIIATAALGAIDELIQALLPHRVFDLRDMGFNALAGTMAIVASLALSRVRRRR